MTGMLIASTVAVTAAIPPHRQLSSAWVVLALIGVLVLAYGLKRLADHVLLTKGDTCRLEGDR
jgi:hypothetical protein